MNQTALAIVGAASLFVLACGDGAAAARPDAGSGPGPVPQRGSVLYEGALWTKPAGGSFGTSLCRIRRSLPGCELLTEPVLVAAATEGARLVAVVARNSPTAEPQYDLLVSDNLGTTVRRFSLDVATNGNPGGTLHLFGGRIFVLLSNTSVSGPSVSVLEVDPLGGAITARGSLSAPAGHSAANGVLTTVGFVRPGPPPVIAITRFDPRTNAIRRDEIPCADEACALGPWTFVSSDGDTFDVLTQPEIPSHRCVVTVRVSSLSVGTECPSTLPTGSVSSVSSFGGTAHDFLFITPEGDVAWSLMPAARHWTPAGPPLLLGVNQVYWKGDSFFAFSPPELAVGEDVLLRLEAGGTMKKTAVQHEGCLTVGPYWPKAGCSQMIAVLPLPGEGLLFVGQRDEFQDDTQSRILFDVGQSHAPFEDFELPAVSP